MEQNIQDFVNYLKKQKAKAAVELARARGAVQKWDEKLADPEAFYSYENKRGAKKLKKLGAVPEVKEKKESKPILVKKNFTPGTLVEVEIPEGVTYKEKSSEKFWE